MNPSIFEIQADYCKAMGNTTRLQIIHALRAHPMNVGNIAQAMKMSQSLVSRQLATLRNAGVVQYKRQGNEMIYQLTDESVGEICDLVRRVLSAQMHKQSEAFQ